MERPIVLCGLGRMGARVLEYLQAARMPVVIVDTLCQADDPRLNGTRLVTGDCRRREVLETAGVAEASGVLILTGDDLLNISTTLMVRGLNPEVRIVLRMFNQDLLERLGQALRNVFALSTSMLTAPILAMTAMTGQTLGTFRLGTQADDRRQLVQVAIDGGSGLRGRTLDEIVASRAAVVVAHFKEGRAGRYLGEVDLKERLESGDELVVCGEPRALASLLESAGNLDAPHLLWAGWLRRMSRVVHRACAEIDWAVLICTLVLVTVIIVSTLVFHLGVDKDTLPDALFRTISVMATGASMHEEDFVQSGGMKVFVSVLRILGAALTATFTAIVTNYLLRARLGGAFEVRRIPDSGHVLVCGLGPIGFRVIEELIGAGERVVVIERDPDNRFVSTARRLGAAVVLGDAGVGEVLRQAHASTAYAVIAATNNDLTNLAVALRVRETNPRQRVVLLLSDPQFAQMLRDAANVRLAYSVPVLAAPAFLAGLYGNRVQSVFQIRDHLLAVIDLVVQPQDALINLSVRAMARDYALVPVAVLPAQGTASHQSLDARFEAGDRLVAIVSFQDLDRLLRRQPSLGPFPTLTN